MISMLGEHNRYVMLFSPCFLEFGLKGTIRSLVVDDFCDLHISRDGNKRMLINHDTTDR